MYQYHVPKLYNNYDLCIVKLKRILVYSLDAEDKFIACLSPHTKGKKCQHSSDYLRISFTDRRLAIRSVSLDSNHHSQHRAGP